MPSSSASATGLISVALLAVVGAGMAALPSSAGPNAAVTPGFLAARKAEGVIVQPVARGAAPPVELHIPRMRLRNRLVGLRVAKDGTLETPKDYARAGWWREGPAPGDPGPAIIVGHVDSREGPAVFFKLPSLRKGDPIAVRRADGTTVTFRVDTVRTYDKRRFPTKEVYGATKDPQLRLITCGGTFDRRSRHYRDNVVVFASLARPAAPRPPAPPAPAPAPAPAKHRTGRLPR